MNSWDKDPIITNLPGPAAASAPAPWDADDVLTVAPRVLELRAGLPLPAVFKDGANPFSAGRFPLGRVYTVGDRAVMRKSDLWTGKAERDRELKVTGVDPNEGRVEINGGVSIWDLMGNHLKVPGSRFRTPRQFTPADLYVGKRWNAVYQGEGVDGMREVQVSFAITRREWIEVPAGRLFAFRIEGIGWANFADNVRRMEETLWLLPFLNFPVCHNRKMVDSNSAGLGRPAVTISDQLVSVHQQVFAGGE